MKAFVTVDIETNNNYKIHSIIIEDQLWHEALNFTILLVNELINFFKLIRIKK